MAEATRAAVYCRISSDRDGTALGVQRQESLCRDLAERKGWEVAEVYVDNDVSAYSGKPRPAYERMLADLEAGARNAVIVVDTDRLTRAPKELEHFIEVADAHGVALANVSGDMDLSSSDGRFRARILGAVARQESEKKSERIRRQREQLATSGRPHPGPRAFGFEADGMTHREHEATLIRRGAQALLSGSSFRDLANEWNDVGVTTARGGKWNVQAVALLYRQPRLAGHRVHKGEVIGRGAWEPIIDEVTWRRLQATSAARKRGPGQPPKYLLSGILRCGICGQAMRSSAGKAGRRTYACQKDAKRDSCGRLSVLRRGADGEAKERVLSVVAGGGLAAAAGRATSDDSEVRRLNDALRRDREMLEELAADYYQHGRISRTEFFTNRDRLEERIGRTSERLDQAGRSLPNIPASVDGGAEWWEVAAVDARRQVVEFLVDHIVVKPYERGRPRQFDPERLGFAWRS